MKTGKIATFFAVLAAALYAINIPLSKVLMAFVQPTMMAALLYLGAGLGLFLLGKVTKTSGQKLTKAELPYTIGMVVLDIAAPFLGVLFGILILGERPDIRFYIGLVIMVAATVLMVKDTISLQHTHAHSHVHTHAHAHGDLVHTHTHAHVHTHTHVHGQEESTHTHTHTAQESHDHTHDSEE